MCSPYENPAGRSRRRRVDDKNSLVYSGLARFPPCLGIGRHQGPSMQHSVGTDEEHSAALLVAAAEALLTAQNPTVPSDFVAGLFDRAAPEDLVRYDGRDIAALAESAWAFLAERTPGAPKLRIATPAGGQRAAAPHLGDRDRQRRHAVPARLGDGRAGGARRRGAAGRASGVHGHARSVGPAHRLRRTAASGREGASRESFIHIHLDRIADEAQRAELLAALETVLADVRLGVQDWRAMTARVGEIAAELKVNPPPLPKEEIEEAVAFLEWLVGDNFTFLGARDYVLRQGGRAGADARDRARAACARPTAACCAPARSSCRSRRSCAPS